MSRRWKVVRNVTLFIILFIVFMKFFSLYLTPRAAYEHAERKSHYGPSRMVHMYNFEGDKYFLCTYDKWISVDKVNRSLFFLWNGDNPSILENDNSMAVKYTWSISNTIEGKVFGIVNDDRIRKLEVVLEDGRQLIETQFYDKMFLFHWKSQDSGNCNFTSFKGYDSENNLIFEGDKFIG